MIISKEVEIVAGSKNCLRLESMYGIKNIKPGDKVRISINKLRKGSHCVIEVSCDYCGKILNVPFKRFNLSTKYVKKYSCSKKDCSNSKIKDVCLFKYGVENPFQSNIIKNKIKETLETKYGVSHPMHLESTKEKIKDTCLEKYGTTSYMKTEECKEKIRSTNMIKYGVMYSAQTTEGQEKRKKTRISNGSQLPDHLVEPYKTYRREVDKIYDRKRKEVLENWNGIDYYDGEYIRDNFNLNCYDRNYPSYDHKISAYYGFINNIPPEIIGDLSNVCITKNWINGLKGEKCAEEFIKEFRGS
jgi:hypothetical protein